MRSMMADARAHALTGGAHADAGEEIAAAAAKGAITVQLLRHTRATQPLACVFPYCNRTLSCSARRRIRGRSWPRSVCQRLANAALPFVGRHGRMLVSKHDLRKHTRCGVLHPRSALCRSKQTSHPPHKLSRHVPCAQRDCAHDWMALWASSSAQQAIQAARTFCCSVSPPAK